MRSAVTVRARDAQRRPCRPRYQLPAATSSVAFPGQPYIGVYVKLIGAVDVFPLASLTVNMSLYNPGPVTN